MVNEFSGLTINHSGLGQYKKSTRTSTLPLVKTHVNHLAGASDPINNRQGVEQGFGNMLLTQLDKTSALDNKAKQLSTQFMLDPNSVNEHDITIASTEATLAINITSNIIQRALDAYRSIISLQ